MQTQRNMVPLLQSAQFKNHPHQELLHLDGIPVDQFGNILYVPIRLKLALLLRF